MEKKRFKVMFICLGNICRSPAAECILRKMAEEAGYGDRIICKSSGLQANYHAGEGADARMANHARPRGYTLNTRATQFDLKRDLESQDLLLFMTKSMLSDVRRHSGHNEKLQLFTDYCTQYIGADGVPDPYYGGAAGFERSLDMIEDGCRALLTHIIADLEN